MSSYLFLTSYQLIHCLPTKKKGKQRVQKPPSKIYKSGSEFNSINLSASEMYSIVLNLFWKCIQIFQIGRKGRPNCIKKTNIAFLLNNIICLGCFGFALEKYLNAIFENLIFNPEQIIQFHQFHLIFFLWAKQFVPSKNSIKCSQRWKRLYFFYKNFAKSCLILNQDWFRKYACDSFKKN